MLTPDQIKQALLRHGEAGAQGSAAFLRRSNAPAMGVNQLSPAQRQLLAELESVQPAQRIVHPHPANAPTPYALTAGGRKEQNLTQAEMMWLSRLPTEPDQVSFDDASRVLALADAVKAPDERLLLDSIAAPIREYHDALVAAANKMNAQRPVVPMPASAEAALADAIAAEQPNLERHEAQARARDVVAQVHRQKLDARTAALQKADQAIAELNTAAATRTSAYR